MYKEPTKVTYDKEKFISGGTKKRIKKTFGRWYGLFLIVVTGIIIFFLILNLKSIGTGISKFFGYIRPVLIGIVLAYILNPLMKLINRLVLFIFRKINKKEVQSLKVRKFARGLGITFSMLIAVAVIYAVIAMIIPSLFSSVMNLVNGLPGQANKFYKYITSYVSKSRFMNKQMRDMVLGAADNMDEIVNNSVIPWFKSEFLPNVNNIMASLATGVFNVFNFVLNIIIGFIVCIYILMSTEKFTAGSKKIIYGLFDKRQSEIILHYSRVTNEMFGGFLIGKIIDSFILGICTFIFCSIVDVPYTMLVAVIMGITNMIPIFGQYIGAIPSLLLVLIVSPVKCLTLLIFIVVMKQIDGNLIGPALIGNSTGLSAFWVLFAILVFGGMFGIAGMILGVPLFAVLYRIVGDYIDYRLVKKSLEKNTVNYINLKNIDVDKNGRNRYVKFTSEEINSKKMRNDEEGKITLSSIVFKNEVLRKDRKANNNQKTNKAEGNLHSANKTGGIESSKGTESHEQAESSEGGEHEKKLENQNLKKNLINQDRDKS